MRHSFIPLVALLLGMAATHPTMAEDPIELPHVGTRADALRDWAMQLLSQGETTWGQAALYQLAMSRHEDRLAEKDTVPQSDDEVLACRLRKASGFFAAYAESIRWLLEEHRENMQWLRQRAYEAHQATEIVTERFEASELDPEQAAAMHEELSRLHDARAHLYRLFDSERFIEAEAIRHWAWLESTRELFAALHDASSRGVELKTILPELGVSELLREKLRESILIEQREKLKRRLRAHEAKLEHSIIELHIIAERLRRLLENQNSL